ncbi:hypothetical protein sscle_14g098770 [Sclerotinia sclerotiorum 1980 UF-70]|uniref:Uncharacterized protein n=1 Tax=Sclerotinia sclerotiorum (strain ATCC 18683 / 1980 / Ss-1) TaxID=665079 RepID=A0A1D9QJI3_SCLS1|nr:hypothetical protein sscle_14g098770 [Sclerotinia sclerotiorum 1980 UF-70]
MAAEFMGAPLVQSVITSIFATGVKEIADVSRLGTPTKLRTVACSAEETTACRLEHVEWFIGEFNCTGIERES